jgi:hypothetical protein
MTTAMILDRRALRPLPCALLFSFFLFRSSFFLPLFPIPYSPLPAPGWIGGWADRASLCSQLVDLG